jgi:hypothetical protein
MFWRNDLCPINCSKRVSGEQKPLTNTCSPTRQLIIYPCAMRVFWVVDTSIHAPSGACFLGILLVSFHMNLECSQMPMLYREPLYHPLALCQLYPFTMRVLWDLDTFCHVRQVHVS